MRPVQFAGVASLFIGSLALPTECFAAQWVTNITVTQAIAGNSGGEYAQLIVSGTVVNPAGCASPDSYIVHDAALVRDALAIGMTAFTCHPNRADVSRLSFGPRAFTLSIASTCSKRSLGIRRT